SGRQCSGRRRRTPMTDLTMAERRKREKMSSEIDRDNDIECD
ncbi:unnamed protein product, partial [Linum tenue]